MSEQKKQTLSPQLEIFSDKNCHKQIKEQVGFMEIEEQTDFVLLFPPLKNMKFVAMSDFLLSCLSLLRLCKCLLMFLLLARNLGSKVENLG